MSTDAQDNAGVRYFGINLDTPSTDLQSIDALADTYAISNIHFSGRIHFDGLEETRYTTPSMPMSSAAFTPNLLSEHLDIHEVLAYPSYRHQIAGDTVGYHGLELTIVGSAEVPDEWVISTAFMRDQRIPFDQISFWTDDVLHGDGFREIESVLHQSFGAFHSFTGEDVIQARLQETPLSLVFFSVFYCFSMIAYGYVLTYMLERQAYSFWLNRTLGLSARKALLLSLCEHVVFTGVTFLIAVVIHRVLWTPLFQELTVNGVTRFKLFDYTLLLLLVLILSFILFVPTYRNWSHQNLAVHTGRFVHET